jgi:hypothetical protein
MARSSFGQKANTRSASGGVDFYQKGAAQNPAFVAFWSQSTIELWAGCGPLAAVSPELSIACIF